MPALYIMAASALLSAYGSYKNKKAAQKKDKDESRLKYEAEQKAWDQAEDQRIGSTQWLQGVAGQRGIKGFENLPASFFAKRPYSGKPPSKESGSSTLGDMASLVGQAGMAYGDYSMQQKGAKSAKAQQDDEFAKLMCQINPNSPECPSRYGPPAPSGSPPDQIFGSGFED